jgi:hypothetical protein
MSATYTAGQEVWVVEAGRLQPGIVLMVFSLDWHATPFYVIELAEIDGSVPKAEHFVVRDALQMSDSSRNPPPILFDGAVEKPVISPLRDN